MPKPSPHFGAAMLLVVAPLGCVSADDDTPQTPDVSFAPDAPDVTPAALDPDPGPSPISPCLGPIFPPVLPPGAGDVDTSFGCRGIASYGASGADFMVRAIAVQSDDKIVAVGSRYVASVNNNDVWVARFTANGSLDTTFATDGIFTTDLTFPLGGGESANAVVISGDGGIIVGGGVNREDGELRKAFLIRLTPAGALDTTFATDGIMLTSAMTSVNALRYQSSNDQVVAAGQRCTAGADTCTAAVGRFYADNGSPDAIFSLTGVRSTNLGGSAPSNALGATLYAGKVVIGGTMKGASSGSDLGAARYDALGLDTSFGASGFKTYNDAASESITAATTVSFGEFILAGHATPSGQNQQFVLRRLNADGSTDTAFGANGRVVDAFAGYGAAAYAVTNVTGSKIVAVGTAKTASGKNRAAVARFSSSGSLDTTFSYDGNVMLTGSNDQANGTSVAVQSTGRIIVGGWSTNTANVRRGFLYALHDD